MEIKEMNEPFCYFVDGDARRVLRDFGDGVFDLTVTSPPYNVGKEYVSSKDDLTMEEYTEMMEEILREVYRVTAIGGRLAINIPLTGNSPINPKNKELIFFPNIFYPICINTGWTSRDYVIWVKTREPENPNNFCGADTAWGSWRSPSSPYLRSYA